MIDRSTEKLLPLSEAKRLPEFQMPDGSEPSPPTLWRWRNRGVRSPKGDRVKLETLRLPGGIFTSYEAIGRFVAALNGAPSCDRSQDTPRRVAAIDAAERELAAAGIR